MSRARESSSAPDASLPGIPATQDRPSDSLHSASDSTDSSSAAQKASSGCSGRATKRKITQDSTSLHSRVKRLKASYNDHYRILFNETVSEIKPNKRLDQLNLPLSQIGATLWCPEEKNILFNSLARRGRHAIQQIAADVGSKSESEVFIYLEKIQQAVVDEQVYGSSKKLPNVFDIPAALAISHDCCLSLDVAAETLSVLQQQEEEKLEKKKHGSLSLLTPTTAQWVKRCLGAGGEGSNELSEVLPAAELLNLKTFLDLSKRFFMNSKIMENNWRTYTYRRKSPTITYTAFSDFHTLAISVTSRIVQSSLFCAMSRRRALQASGRYKSGPHVKKADVAAALNALSMDVNGKKLWAGVARKCRLRVYETMKNRNASGKRYSYDEIEAVMSSVPSKARGRSRAVSRGVVDPLNTQEEEMLHNPSSSVSDNSESSNPLSATNEYPDHSSDSALSSNELDDKHAIKEELRDQAQDVYAEILDQRASRAHERHLWELLGEDPEERLPSEEAPLPKMPMAQRKDKEDIADWKTQVNFTGEWVMNERPVPSTSFAENRRLGRGLGVAAGLTESDTDSEDAVDTSSRRNSSRGKPLSDEFVHDESESEQQDSGTEGEGEGKEEEEKEAGASDGFSYGDDEIMMVDGQAGSKEEFPHSGDEGIPSDGRSDVSE